jgi:hypothetical protein
MKNKSNTITNDSIEKPKNKKPLTEAQKEKQKESTRKFI